MQYPARESKALEFKSTVKKFDAIVRTAIAFANGVGGKIIVGIDDETRNIVSVDQKTRDKIYDELPNSLYDSTSPNLIPQIYEQRFGEASVIVIEIPPALKKPCCLRRLGLPKGVYIRVGSSTRVANDEIIESLYRENQRRSFDEEPVHVGSTALSDDLLRTHYANISQAALLEDKILVRSEVNQECYMPTVAGTLLFSENPERAIPEALVICTRFSGVSGRNIIQTEEIKGPLSKQIAVSFELVSSWLRRHYQLQGARMTAKSLVPDIALREAVINAVIHRKYTIPGATKIALYEDRLEIFSPGNFPGHVNIDNLGEGITHLRNPILGRMLHRMGMIEKLGSGIRAMFDSCRTAKLALPTFSEDGDYVKVIFRFQPLAEKAQTDADKLIALLGIREIVTVADIVDYLGRSRNTVLSLLHQLMLEEKVQRLGKGRATHYGLK